MRIVAVYFALDIVTVSSYILYLMFIILRSIARARPTKKHVMLKPLTQNKIRKTMKRTT